MSTTPTDTQVRFGRRSTRGLILGFSAPRVIVMMIAAAVAIVAVSVDNAPGLVVSAVVWLPLGASAFIRVGGRPVIEWTATWLRYGTRKAAGQGEYRSKLALAPRPAGTLALPGDAASLRMHVDGISGAVMIHDPHRHTLTAVVSVSHPAFVLLDHDDRNQRVSRWGRVYAALAQSGTTAAIQVLEAAVPDPASGQAEWYATNGQHNGSWADTQYQTLLDQVRLAAGTHRTVIALAVDLRRAARAVRAAGGGMAGSAAVLRGDMASLADLLRQAGLNVNGWLSDTELAAIIRTAYDPDAVLEGHQPGANLTHAGPMAVSEHWDCLRHDSGWSRVLWVAEWPRIEVTAEFLHSVIFAPNVRRSLSIIARPLPTDTAIRQIRKEKTEAVADMAHKAKIGQVAQLSDAQEYDDLLARERSVIAGHTDVEFAGFITVTAPTPDELDAATAQITRAAAQSACEARPLYGRQAQGFISAALPLARHTF